MRTGPSRRASSAPKRCTLGWLVAGHGRALTISLLLGFCVAGCANGNSERLAALLNTPLINVSAPASTPSAATVAFESIDGPPMGIFRKLVQNLKDEADARQLAVVSRESAPQYRIRGYISAQVERRQASFVWVWDVYDADQRRAVRLVGEEKAGPAQRDAWLTADDQLLRRIAQASMNQLAAFLANPGAAPPGQDDRPLTVAAMTALPGETPSR